MLGTAIDLADAHGLTALSMRKLGQELGVEAMSLYNHVANKDDLLAGMLEVVYAEFDLPSARSDWKTALRQIAISAHDALVQHSWACNLQVGGTDGVGPARMRYMESVLGTMRGAGFSVVLTHRAFHVFDIYVVGYAAQEASFDFDREELPELAAVFLQRLPTATYPFLTEHINHHIEADHFDEGDFLFGLDLILDGFERLHERG